MLADLHIHSCFSDGTNTPEEIAVQASQKGIGLLSITDHNDIRAYARAAAACRAAGIRLIRGVEADCRYQGRILHILLYDFKPEERLLALLRQSKSELLRMSVDLVERMASTHPDLSAKDYAAYDYNCRKGGWKGIHYLCDRGVTKTPEEGMRYYFAYGCDYTAYDFPPAEEICAAAIAAGGKPVLAHPCNWFAGQNRQALFATLDGLREIGVQGVECYYPANSPQMTEWCLDYCRLHGLYATAGGDGHGDFARVSKGVLYEIGAASVDERMLTLWPGALDAK